jgi:hypothetical protein
MHVHGLFVWWSTRAQQGIDQPGKPIGLADDHVRVFLELVFGKLPLE